MLLCFAVQGFAQNNDMKARMEFEDAETAYSNKDYSKAVTHLESAEKLLGKPTGKTRYLLILALNKNLAQDYQYQDLEKLRGLCKHYLDNYTTDTEKYREIYDLSNNLDKNYPKNLEEYNQIKQEKQEKLRLAQRFILTLLERYGYKANLPVYEFAKLSSAHQRLIDLYKYDNEKDEVWYYYGAYGVYVEKNGIVRHLEIRIKKEDLNNLIKETQRNLDEKFYSYEERSGGVKLLSMASAGIDVWITAVYNPEYEGGVSASISFQPLPNKK